MNLSIALVCVLLIYFVSAKLISVISHVIHTRLRIFSITLAEDNEVPVRIKHCLTNTASILNDEGFLFSHFEKRQDIETIITIDRWVAIYFQPTERIYAEVETALKPSNTNPVGLSFISVYPTGRIITLDITRSPIAKRSAGTQCYQSVAPGYHAQLFTHREILEKSRLDDSSQPDALQLDPADYSARVQSDIRDYFDELYDNGIFTKENDTYKVGYKNVLRMLFRQNELVKQISLKKADIKPNQKTTENILPLEVDAYCRQQEVTDNLHVPFNFKLGLFLLSLATCSLFFSAVFSWHYALFLIPVLIIHELGHLFAMMYFGYTNKYMLFMPLGAFVVGESRDAARWQQMVVFLAGPLPGIILATGLYLFIQEPSENMTTFIAITLALNFLNLLPIAPLDGGHIVRLFISPKFPTAQFVFQLVSLIICALVVWFLRDPFIAVIAVFLTLGLLASYKQIKINRAFAEIMQQKTVNQKITPNRWFDIVKGYAAEFDEKLQMVKDFSSMANQRPAPVYLAPLFMAIYLAFLASPIVVVTLAPSLATNFRPSIEADFDNDQFLREQLEYAGSREERIDAYIEHAQYEHYSNNLKSAEQSLLTAISLATDSEQEELQAQAYSQLLYLYRDQENAEKLATTEQLLEEKAETSDVFKEKLAYHYLYSIPNNDFIEDTEQLKRSKQVAEWFVQLEDQNGVLESREALSDYYFQHGERQTARDIRTASTELDLGDDNYLRARAFIYLSEQDIIESRLNDARDNITQSIKLMEEQYGTGLPELRLAWVSLLQGNTNEIRSIVSSHQQSRANANKEMMSELDFATRMLMRVSGHTENLMTLPEFELLLAAVYLGNNMPELQRLVDQYPDLVFNGNEFALDEMKAEYSYTIEQSNPNSLQARQATILLDALATISVAQLVDSH